MLILCYWYYILLLMLLRKSMQKSKHQYKNKNDDIMKTTNTFLVAAPHHRPRRPEEKQAVHRLIIFSAGLFWPPSSVGLLFLQQEKDSGKATQLSYLSSALVEYSEQMYSKSVLSWPQVEERRAQHALPPHFTVAYARIPVGLAKKTHFSSCLMM